MKTKMNFKYCFLILGIIFCLPIYGQNTSNVKGTVSDESGVPLPGVSIIVKNTTKGTATDFDGNYSIAVNTNDVLVFSFLGYKTQEVAVKGRTTINLNLSEDKNVLDEVVVIGYGSTTRRDVTGAISSVSGEKLASVPVADAAQALQGKLPGVRVTTQDGRPGADIAIRVRGGGSITQSNQPLFIVDGFRVPSISDIPGDQIKSIDVLKDASSTAIYGASGANGVIIVTTKGGIIGKTKVSYNGYTQFSVIPEYVPIMNGYDYIAYNWGYADAIGSGYRDAWEKLWAIGPQSTNFSNPDGIDYYKTVASRDYNKELYNSAFSHNHNFNVSGGTENTRYLFAVNYLDQEGNKVGSSYERTNAQFRLDQNLGDKLKLSINTRYSQVNRGNNDGDSHAYYFRPINSSDILGDSDVTSNTQLGDYNGILQDAFSPISILNDSKNIGLSRSLVSSGALSWEIVPGLTAKTNIQLVSNWSSSKTWRGPAATNRLDSEGNPLQGGDAKLAQKQGWNYRWANTLNYQVQGLGEDHKLGILAGYEVADSGSESVTVEGYQYPVSFDAQRAWDNMASYTLAPTTVASSAGGTPDRLQSLFGQLNYGYKDKYLLTGTFRADGSSRFAPANRWGYFPAGAIAWRASEEDFLKGASWLDDLKVRFSYGSVGNDDIRAELWKQNWRPVTVRWSLNDVSQPGYDYATPTLFNEELKWETTISRNLGLDFQLFGNKLNGTLELYKNTVKDLLMIIPVPPLTGFETKYANAGQTSNKGIELSLGGDIVKSENFNLTASINININKNNVDSLDPSIDGKYSSGFGGVYFNPRQDYFLEVGKPVGLFRGYIHDGWYTTDDFDYDPTTQIYTTKAGVPKIESGILGTVYGTVGNKPAGQSEYPGVQKIKDISGPNGVPDGIINADDITVIGDANPGHTGGFNLAGNYKQFDFNFDFTWSVGNDIYNASHVEAYAGNKEQGLYRNRYQELAGAYKIYDIVNGQLTKVVDPAALDALNANATTFLPYPENGLGTSFGIEDGSYLRLNTFTLGYSLPQRIVDKFGIGKFRVYGSIFNAFTLTGYKGFDPEINVKEDRDQNDNQYNPNGFPTPGLDLNAYPRPRTFTFGLNVEF
ncbi:SusC/RagA family TonB-linked outer membrane protein [Mariniflexile sp. HNIBRBA6329]|uniref:SusC/RagA family TonB-linked outer membrane protein n=1 Tax=Mariniflexile sp. HNIBRBA6329 TaxID=3373088 RepID=UPI003744D8C9